MTGTGCTLCGKSFAETKGTPFYRAHKPHAEITQVLTLLAYGCPVLQEAAGEHCEAVHEHLVEEPRDLGQVQADEIWVKAQEMILYHPAKPKRPRNLQGKIMTSLKELTFHH